MDLLFPHHQPNHKIVNSPQVSGLIQSYVQVSLHLQLLSHLRNNIRNHLHLCLKNILQMEHLPDNIPHHLFVFHSHIHHYQKYIFRLLRLLHHFLSCLPSRIFLNFLQVSGPFQNYTHTFGLLQYKFLHHDNCGNYLLLHRDNILFHQVDTFHNNLHHLFEFHYHNHHHRKHESIHP